MYQIDSNGVQTVCASGFRLARGIATDVSGNLYVTDEALGALYRIPKGCGAVQTVVSNAQHTWFVTPRDVAIDANNNAIVSMMSADVNWATRGIIYAYRRVYQLPLNANGVWSGNATLLANSVADGLSYVGNLGYGSAADGLWGSRANKFITRWTAASTPTGWNDWLGAAQQTGLATPVADIIDIEPAWAKCGALFFAASDNNRIYRCADINNPSSCVALCQTHTDSAGCDQVWAPWGVAVDCDCNVLATSNGNSKITTYTRASGYAVASVSARLPTVPYSLVVANVC